MLSKSTYHALLNSSIGHNIDDISNTVLLEVCSEVDHTLLLEVAREGCGRMSLVSVLPLSPLLFPNAWSAAHTIASTSAETCSVTHLDGGV